MAILSWSIRKATSGNIVTDRWDLKTPYLKSDEDAFDLIKGHILAPAIIELGGACVSMISHIARFFK